MNQARLRGHLEALRHAAGAERGHRALEAWAGLEAFLKCAPPAACRRRAVSDVRWFGEPEAGGWEARGAIEGAACRAMVLMTKVWELDKAH